MTLPEGTDSINVPKIATGTTVAAQTADAAGVSSTDLTDSVATAAVKTLAGQQDIALQLIEQSPGSFDEIVAADLLADYNMKLDQQCIVGSGASGQVQGINGLSGTNGITYTSGAPTGPLTYAPVAQAISQIAGNRYLPPTAIVMHPRRFFWLAAALDTANRPLVVPSAAGPYNPEAVQTGMAAEGPIANMLGLPVYIDPNVPVLQGAGTEDRIYVVRAPDLLLWEGNLRTRVLPEVLSGTLQVRIQLYNYFAWMPDRYPKAISVVSGTGLIAPSGF